MVITHAGGGNLTGTARGLLAAGCVQTRVVACSVDLSGLHMASDHDFNRKSFTTGHTGFGVPFAVWPDRVDVPRSAARPLRYMDEYQLVTQGEVFYVTELLTKLEGLERGPSGNTSLTAAVTLATQMDREQIVVVQETEYTGAGKHHNSQLAFAREHGIEVRLGDPVDSVPAKSSSSPKRSNRSGQSAGHRTPAGQLLEKRGQEGFLSTGGVKATWPSWPRTSRQTLNGSSRRWPSKRRSAYDGRQSRAVRRAPPRAAAND